MGVRNSCQVPATTYIPKPHMLLKIHMYLGTHNKHIVGVRKKEQIRNKRNKIMDQERGLSWANPKIGPQVQED